MTGRLLYSISGGSAEELLEDGSLLLTIPVSHGQEIMMEILKHGSHVTLRKAHVFVVILNRPRLIGRRRYPIWDGRFCKVTFCHLSHDQEVPAMPQT